MLGNGGYDFAKRNLSASVSSGGATGKITIAELAAVSAYDTGVVDTTASEIFNVAIFCPLLDTASDPPTTESVLSADRFKISLFTVTSVASGNEKM